MKKNSNFKIQMSKEYQMTNVKSLKFKFWIFFGIWILSFVISSCGGSSDETASSVTITLIPANAAANVAVTASITATFSADITEPSNWTTAFTLKKSDTGETLCTSVTYSSLVATCAHADLETGASYTVRVAGVKDSSGTSITDASSTFATTGSTPVGGSVTIKGTLSAVSASLNPKGIEKALDVTSYKVLILNDSTAEQTTATVAADGTFTMTGVGGSSYMINFLDSNNKYVGTLEAGTISSDKVSMGVFTGADESTTDLGTVSANTSTGKITSDQTLTTDSIQLAYVSGGVIAGGNSGVGSTDYTTSVGATACTSGAITCPDLDHDGVPDILDTDNDNNTYADEIDGKVDKCVPGTVKLYVVNYPTCTNATCAQMNFPTQDEVDAHLASDTMYTIHLEFTPGTGYTMSDISEISVTTPSYVDSYGYVYDVINTDACFNKLWSDCNGKKLRVMDSDPTKYQIVIADSDPQSLKQGRLLSAMYPGDTFILNIALTSGTTHVCTKKINIIPKYYPYALKYSGSAVNTDATPTWETPIEISWTTPSRGPTGMTYAVYLAPYTTCSDVAAGSLTSVYSAQDATSATILVESLPTSAVNKWGLQLWATDEVGDKSQTGWAKFKTAASSCGND